MPPSFLSLLEHQDDFPPLFLAPMAGYTNAAMRCVSSHQGALCTYTEMTNGHGLILEKEKTWHLLETLPDEGPVVAHLYGSEPDIMGEAAAKVEACGRFVAIDLNAGCPVHKVTAGGAGSALVHHPDLVYEILHSMVSATALPVTIKTRLGPRPDQIAIFELLDAARRAGAAALTIHGRFTSERHSGPVHLDLMAEVRQRSKIPIIANGGITSSTTAWETLRRTGCDALMIARGAIGNPWIFSDIRKEWRGMDEPPFVPKFPGLGRSRRGLREIRDAFYFHWEHEKKFVTDVRTKYQLPATAITPEEAMVSTFRCHLFRYLRGLQGSGHLRRHLSDFKTEKEILKAVDDCLENEAGFRAEHLAFYTE